MRSQNYDELSPYGGHAQNMVSKQSTACAGSRKVGNVMGGYLGQVPCQGTAIRV